MATRKAYVVWIGSLQYHTRAENSQEAKRNVAHQHRNRGYDPTKTIEQIMSKAKVKHF